MSVAERTRRASDPTDRGELVGTIAGLVVVIPLLAALGYGGWLLLQAILG